MKPEREKEIRERVRLMGVAAGPAAHDARDLLAALDECRRERDELLSDKEIIEEVNAEEMENLRASWAERDRLEDELRVAVGRAEAAEDAAALALEADVARRRAEVRAEAAEKNYLTMVDAFKASERTVKREKERAEAAEKVLREIVKTCERLDEDRWPAFADIHRFAREALAAAGSEET